VDGKKRRGGRGRRGLVADGGQELAGLGRRPHHDWVVAVGRFGLAVPGDSFVGRDQGGKPADGHMIVARRVVAPFGTRTDTRALFCA